MNPSDQIYVLALFLNEQVRHGPITIKLGVCSILEKEEIGKRKKREESERKERYQQGY